MQALSKSEEGLTTKPHTCVSGVSNCHVSDAQSSHRGEDKLSGVVNEGSQAGGQVNALGAAPQAMVKDLDEILQAVLVHGINEWQVSHDEVQDGAPLRERLVLLPG